MDPVNPDQAGTACWTCPPGIPPPNNNANSYAYWVKQVQPTAPPTAAPTPAPTVQPTATPTAAPTPAPTVQPTATPTAAPTPAPTAACLLGSYWCAKFDDAGVSVV